MRIHAQVSTSFLSSTNIVIPVMAHHVADVNAKLFSPLALQLKWNITNRVKGNIISPNIRAKFTLNVGRGTQDCSVRMQLVHVSVATGSYCNIAYKHPQFDVIRSSFNTTVSATKMALTYIVLQVTQYPLCLVPFVILRRRYRDLLGHLKVLFLFFWRHISPLLRHSTIFNTQCFYCLSLCQMYRRAACKESAEVSNK